jgi:hypothetical protein
MAPLISFLLTTQTPQPPPQTAQDPILGLTIHQTPLTDSLLKQLAEIGLQLTFKIPSKEKTNSSETQQK